MLAESGADPLNTPPPKSCDPRTAQLPFLESLRLGHAPITVYLVNGVRVSGTVEGYDDYTILLSGGQLLMKSAVCSVMAGPPAGWR